MTTETIPLTQGEGGARPTDQALVNDAPAGHRPSGFDPSRMDDTDWHVLAQEIASNWPIREEQFVAYQAAGEALKLFRAEIQRRDRNEARNCINWGPCSVNDGAMSEASFFSCDSDASLAENAKRSSGEAVAARAGGIAQTPSSEPTP